MYTFTLAYLCRYEVVLSDVHDVCTTETIASNNMTTDIAKDLGGRGRDLTEALCRHLPRGPKGNHVKPPSR
jgi:hypothetical protein